MELETRVTVDQKVGYQKVENKIVPAADDRTSSRSITMIKQEYSTHYLHLNPEGLKDKAYQGAAFYYAHEFLPVLPPSASETRILDVGSGLGHLIRFLSEKGYRQVGGVEIDATLAEMAREYLVDKAEFIENSDAGTFLGSHENEFDAIIMSDVIEHFSLDEALHLLTATRSALRQTGRVILRTPNMANVLGAYSRYIDLTHQIGFTEFSLKQLLHQAGFTEVHLHVPTWNGSPRSWRLKVTLNLLMHKWMFRMQNRSRPECYSKNIVMWAIK